VTNTEADTCRKRVMPKLQAAGWDNIHGGGMWPHSQTIWWRGQFSLHLMLTIHPITQVAIHCNQAHPKDGFGRLDQEALNLTIELMKQEGPAEEVPAVDTRGTA
jgi:hypothetical protein